MCSSGLPLTAQTHFPASGAVPTRSGVTPPFRPLSPGAGQTSASAWRRAGHLEPRRRAAEADEAPGPPGAPARRADKSRTRTALTFETSTECQVPTRTAKFWEDEFDPAEAAAVPSATHPRGAGRAGSRLSGRALWALTEVLPGQSPARGGTGISALQVREARLSAASRSCRTELGFQARLSDTKPLLLALLHPDRVGVCRSDSKPITKHTSSQLRCRPCPHAKEKQGWGWGVEPGARGGGGEALRPHPGPSDPPGPSGRTEPGPPAGARTDWRSRSASSSLTCPSQPIGATRIGAVAGSWGRWCRLEAEPPSPPSSRRARPNRES